MAAGQSSSDRLNWAVLYDDLTTAEALIEVGARESGDPLRGHAHRLDSDDWTSRNDPPTPLLPAATERRSEPSDVKDQTACPILMLIGIR